MSKYNKGDKFEIEIKEVVVSECYKVVHFCTKLHNTVRSN